MFEVRSSEFGVRNFLFVHRWSAQKLTLYSVLRTRNFKLQTSNFKLQKIGKKMLILGIESSCDESAAAVVKDGTQVLSSVIHTQIALHAPHGGVVPEIASRSHIEQLPSVIDAAVKQAGITYSDIDAVAVTYGPGLASSLLVGLSAAKGLAASLGKPLIGINHIHAHIQSAFLPDIEKSSELGARSSELNEDEKSAHKENEPPSFHTPHSTLHSTPQAENSELRTPNSELHNKCLALVVSGGHSAIVEIGDDGIPYILGQTLDDAAGEAFDKASKLLGLGYPGGPAIQKAADKATDYSHIRFPQGRIGDDNPALGSLDAELCFSFSGLKTSLRTYLERNPVKDEQDIYNIAAAYQDAIVEALAKRVTIALSRKKYNAIAVGGGVSLNAALRKRLTEIAQKAGIPIHLPLPKYCGDNAAMIASLAGLGYGIKGDAAMLLDATPGLALAIRNA